MKKKQVQDFFKLFIKDYLIEDICILNKIKKNQDTGLGACAIPQAMAVLSGIDLLGLLFGNYKDTNDSEKHISEFYRITKSTYPDDRYDETVVKKLVLYRHGMMHNFFPKYHAKNIGICKSDSKKLFIKQTFNNTEIESLNVTFLTEDFLSVVSLLEKKIDESSDNAFFENILISIKDLECSNQLSMTTTTETTVNIVTQNKKPIAPTNYSNNTNPAQ